MAISAWVQRVENQHTGKVRTASPPSPRVPQRSYISSFPSLLRRPSLHHALGASAAGSCPRTSSPAALAGPTPPLSGAAPPSQGAQATGPLRPPDPVGVLASSASGPGARPHPLRLPVAPVPAAGEDVSTHPAPAPRDPRAATPGLGAPAAHPRPAPAPACPRPERPRDDLAAAAAAASAPRAEEGRPPRSPPTSGRAEPRAQRQRFGGRGEGGAALLEGLSTHRAPRGRGAVRRSGPPAGLAITHRREGVTTGKSGLSPPAFLSL